MSKLKANSTFLIGAVLCKILTAQIDPWQIVSQAVEKGGENAATALKMLGAIDNPASRNLLRVVFDSKDGSAISDAASGLSEAQCVANLTRLEEATRDPEVQPKLQILSAIARAQSSESVRVLSEVAGHGKREIAGVAFGLLERMGTLAEPFLIQMVTGGESSWSRETAVSILRRMKSANAEAVFRLALIDSDERVRVAGALGLGQLGDPAGIAQLQTAALNPESEYQTDALVGLAGLGETSAFNKLKALITGAPPATRSQVVWAMARSENVLIKDFAYRLGLEREPAFGSMLAEKLLDPKDRRDLTVLRQMTTSEDEMLRLIAAQRLLGTGSSDLAEPVIMRALASENETIRHFALVSVSRYAPLRRVLPSLLANPDAALQVAALSAIADLRQKDRFKDVGNCLASSVSAVSAAAARTLVAIDPRAAVGELEAKLNSKNSHVRINSAAMLLAALKSSSL